MEISRYRKGVRTSLSVILSAAFFFQAIACQEEKTTLKAQKVDFAEIERSEPKRERPPEPCVLDNGPQKAIDLIPEGVMLMGHVDLRAYHSAPLIEALSTHQGDHGLVSAMRACDLPLEKLWSLDFGVYSPLETVLAISGEGIGRSSTLECVHASLAKTTEHGPWTISRDTCPPELSTKDGHIHAIQVNEHLLLLATGAWSKRVAAHVRGESNPAVTGATLGPLFEDVDRSGTLWAVAAFPDVLQPALVQTPLEKVKTLLLAVDLSEGLQISGAASFAEKDDAKQWQMKLKGMAQVVGKRLSHAEIPVSLAKDFRSKRSGDRVHVSLSFKKKAMTGFLTLLEPQNRAPLQRLLYGGMDLESEKDKQVSAEMPEIPTQTGSSQGDIYAYACAEKDAESCYLLGMMYARGEEIKADGTQAIALYERACTHGHAKSCALLKRTVP